MTHPRPVITSVDPSKTDSISLEGSSTLKIFRNSVNGIQLWRFEVDHAYWWVSPIGIIWGKGTHVASSYDSLLEASNDVEAYSRYLAIKAQSL